MSQNNHVFESEYAQKSIAQKYELFCEKKLNYKDSLFLLHKWLSKNFIIILMKCYPRNNLISFLFKVRQLKLCFIQCTMTLGMSRPHLSHKLHLDKYKQNCINNLGYVYNIRRKFSLKSRHKLFI